jgi:hypothetical protein
MLDMGKVKLVRVAAVDVQANRLAVSIRDGGIWRRVKSIEWKKVEA